jgi:RNA-directed DNA polymerase
MVVACGRCADRVAQEVARRYLEPILEPVFHPDSYGYRPGKSAIDAVRTARERCAGVTTGYSIST